MSTYKVIQDIEAEDHILGPLSLRQFIYGLIAAFFLYLCFISVTKGAAFLLILFLPPALFCGFFAFPFGGDQPTEVWALAKIRFMFKPRVRIWNQSGVRQLVTITVPKKIELQLTDGLTQTEVKSRLHALANTIDSRGWAIKNVASNSFVRPGMYGQGSSERLLNITTMPQPVADYDLRGDDDVLDDITSPLAQQFSTMIDASSQSHRQQIIDRLADEQTVTTQPQQQWFTQSAPAATAPINAAAAEADEAALSAQIQSGLAAQAQANLHLHTLPVSTPEPTTAPTPVQPAPTVPKVTPEPVTPQPDPAILNLAKRNDLNVSTLAREASKVKEFGEDGEVVISLH